MVHCQTYLVFSQTSFPCPAASFSARLRIPIYRLYITHTIRRQQNAVNEKKSKGKQIIRTQNINAKEYFW